MELLESKRADAVRALKSLKDIQLSEFSEITRDAAIQRFEYTVEAVWKYLQMYLREVEEVFHEDDIGQLQNEERTLTLTPPSTPGVDIGTAIKDTFAIFASAATIIYLVSQIKK